MDRRNTGRIVAVTIVVLMTVVMAACTSIGTGATRGASSKSTTTAVRSDQPKSSNENPEGTGSAGEVEFQLNPGHTDFSTDDVGHYWRPAWSNSLAGTVSYPLVVGETVFVFTSGQAHMLYSLNAATGSVNWKVNAHGIVGMAYADRVLFTTQNAMAYLQGEQCSPGFSCRVDTTNGTLSARNPNTGVAEWSTEIHGQALGIPTAADGMIYMTGAYESGGSTVYGIDAASGSKAWSEPVNDGEVSTPAVSSSGVYVAYSCDRIYDFDPSNGAEMWKHLTNCEGGGGDVPVLDGPYLLVQEAYSGIVLNASTGLAATGEVEGGFPASEPPAVTPGNIFLIDNDQILSQSFPLGTSLWTAVGDPEMDTSPIVVNGTIYEGSRSGMLYAFSSKSGALEWTEQLPGPLTENIGEGDGHLVVPAGDTLTTFEPSS